MTWHIRQTHTGQWSLTAVMSDLPTQTPPPHANLDLLCRRAGKGRNRRLEIASMSASTPVG